MIEFLDAQQEIKDVLARCHEQPGVLRHQPNCSYKYEEMVPRSYLIGMAVFREVEVLLTWLNEHEKRKTIPRNVVVSFADRVVDILPAELRKIQLMDETLSKTLDEV